jgi:hypothetical protein
LPTSDPRSAAEALDAFERAGVSFAFLHDEGAAANGRISSDVDIVVDRPAIEVVRTVTQGLREVGLAPVMVWPYDIGGTASIFLSTEDASAGVQIDLLYDPQARGQYGVRSESALAGALPGARWRRLNPSHEIAYLVRKRAAKGDRATLEEMADEVDDIGGILNAASEILTDAGVHVVREWCKNPKETPLGAPRPRVLERAVNRARFPVGFAVALGGRPSGEIQEISKRFSSFLPFVALEDTPHRFLERLSWYISHVAPVRWRPGLFIAVDAPSKGPLPFDLFEGASSIRASRIVEAMASRMRSRLE